MMDKGYVYPQDVLPDMNYSDPKVRKGRCGSCKHSIITNAGANIPGLRCKIMTKLFKRAGYEVFMDQVDSLYGICDYYE